MSNFANCKTCKFKHINNGDGHCHMFRTEPTETCRKHTLVETEIRVPCQNRHCECPVGACSHPGCFDDRANNQEDFCMVMIEGREVPKIRHRVMANAVKEAERLLKRNNGGKAYVLRVVAVAELKPAEPIWVKQ